MLRLLAPAHPSRVRLIILWAVLVLWIITLIVLYYTTIVPRHPSPPERGLARHADRLAATALAR